MNGVRQGTQPSGCRGYERVRVACCSLKAAFRTGGSWSVPPHFQCGTAWGKVALFPDQLQFDEHQAKSQIGRRPGQRNVDRAYLCEEEQSDQEKPEDDASGLTHLVSGAGIFKREMGSQCSKQENLRGFPRGR